MSRGVSNYRPLADLGGEKVHKLVKFAKKLPLPLPLPVPLPCIFPQWAWMRKRIRARARANARGRVRKGLNTDKYSRRYEVARYR